jgi:hypothetical protein
MKFASVLVVLSLLELSTGFLQPSVPHRTAFSTKVVQWSSAKDDRSQNSPRRRSNLDGNTREPTPQEIEIMDEMINKLADAKPYELPNAVRRAFRVISSPRFFMRIADRADKAANSMETEKLSALAANLVATLEAVVETTEETLDERAKGVERILKAAAEPETGEFLVPLLPAQVAGMRNAMEKLEPSLLDEGFLSTVDAWMNKSHQDGIDGMVGILQKILQMYSGIVISRVRATQDATVGGEESPASQLFQKLLQVDTDVWEAEIRQGVQDVPPKALISEIQRTMENVVLGLENGSMAQRVQAEYLRELVSRVENYQLQKRAE